jgi:tRNA pseudouridine55 synthase
LTSLLPQDFQEGLTLLIDKPLNWTSFDVVAKIRNTSRCKKIGHAGTLDPLATGLLIVCTGKKTKSIQAIQDADKTYTLSFCLGATTPSYDAEFPPENIKDAGHITREILEKAMQAFIGQIKQIPPAFSAIKKDGKKAYELARKGKPVELTARQIQIHQFKILNFHSPQHIEAEVHCQKGTYIRSLVHDLGQAVGTGAYLTKLKRTQIGDFSVQNAWNLESLVTEVMKQRMAAEPGQS